MSIIRVNHNQNYTVMSNIHLRDKRLSLKAKGLLSQMLSLPDDWDYTVAGLVAINCESRTAIETALRELKSFGYMTVEKKFPNDTESGRIEYVYTVFEYPTNDAIQEVGKQGAENLPLESQWVENHEQLNKEIQSKEIQNKEKAKDDAREKAFSEFWDAYPKKEAKKDAIRAFAKLKASEYPLLIPAIERQAKEKQWTRERKRYIPNPATWLNGRRWEDETDTIELDEHANLAAKWVAKQIKKRMPERKDLTATEIEEWARHINALHARDGYDWDLIGNIVSFSQEDPFWQTSILSGESLRRNFDRLMAQEARDE